MEGKAGIPAKPPWVMMPQPSGTSFMELEGQRSCWEFYFRCVLFGNDALRNLSASKMCSADTAETFSEPNKMQKSQQ